MYKQLLPASHWNCVVGDGDGGGGGGGFDHNFNQTSYACLLNVRRHR